MGHSLIFPNDVLQYNIIGDRTWTLARKMTSFRFSENVLALWSIG